MNLQARTMTVHMPMVTSLVRFVFPAYSKQAHTSDAPSTSDVMASCEEHFIRRLVRAILLEHVFLKI